MLKKPVFSPAQPLRAETRFSRASFSHRSILNVAHVENKLSWQLGAGG
jgi:hypothetical protein